VALDVALGITPLVLAIAAQHWLTRRFKGRVKAEVAKLVAERRPAPAAAPAAADAV
jgi:hypothetical protein